MLVFVGCFPISHMDFQFMTIRIEETTTPSPDQSTIRQTLDPLLRDPFKVNFLKAGKGLLYGFLLSFVL